MLGVLGAEPVQQLRGAFHDLARRWIARVERAHRVEVDPVADLGGQLLFVLAQIGRQLLAVLGARLGRAEAGERQPSALDAHRLQQLGQQHDQLRVDLGRRRPDRLGADLPELPVAAALRGLGAKEARQVPELHGLRQLVHPVLDVGAAHRSGALGAQRQRPPSAIVERVHLLLDDVGGLPHPPREQLGRLERGRLDPLVAGGSQDPPGVALQQLAASSVVGKDVERALGGLDHRFVASSRRNGLVARSRSSVVIPMWPG